MNDPRLAGAPIVRQTNCRVGAHVFTWTGLDTPKHKEVPPPGTDCECGAYSWQLWQKMQQEATAER